MPDKSRRRALTSQVMPVLLALLIVSTGTAFLLLGTAAVGGMQQPVTLNVGGHRIIAEVAATLGSRDLGLMKRKSLLSSSGMLFVFPESHAWCMWMRDTYIPLSAAFIDDSGAIVNIAEMKPLTTTYHCAAKPVRHVLEMKGGWFREKRVKPGAIVGGIEQAPPGK